MAWIELVRAVLLARRLRPLPASHFCSGHAFFVQQSARVEACLNVHVTFTEGGVHQGHTWCTATPCAFH